MSKVITFSRFFPKGHIREGQPTYFVEKIWNSVSERCREKFTSLEMDPTIKGTKIHTIRAGNKWKVGDKFSPRVWSGTPRRSQQNIIAPDIEIKHIYDIVISVDFFWRFKVKVNNLYFAESSTMNLKCTLENVAYNDGLTLDDFKSWFINNGSDRPPFKGQIICWSDEAPYG